MEVLYGRHDILLYLRDGELFHSLIRSGLCWMNLYEWLTVSLFILLTWLASMSFQVMIDEVKTRPPIQQGASSQLMKWHQSYCSTLNLIRAIEEFFGAFLFISFAKQFVLLNYYLFDITVYWSVNESDRFPAVSIAFLISSIVPVLMIIYASQNMRKKVISKYYPIVSTA